MTVLPKPSLVHETIARLEITDPDAADIIIKLAEATSILIGMHKEVVDAIFESDWEAAKRAVASLVNLKANLD